MTLQELVISDLVINTIYEPIKFGVLTRWPALRVRKTVDDGVTATLETLDNSDNVLKTEQYDSTKHIWQVNL